MKKTINKEVSVCDQCEKECDWATTCMECGKDLCSNCFNFFGTTYAHAVHFSGSGDGHYCEECDIRLIASKTNKRHNAYRQIMALRAEEDNWYRNFRARSGAAESLVSSFETR